MRSARPALVVLALFTSLALSLMAPSTAHAGKKKSAVTVLTLNVCGNAQGCGSWAKREAAVVKRILSSKADVVNLQETWGVLTRLEKRLAKRGYFLAASSGNEGIFAKSSKLSPVTKTKSRTTCSEERIYADPTLDTSGWDYSFPHTDENGVIWYPDEYGRWYHFGEKCVKEKVTTAKAGKILLGGRASSTWAMLRVKKTKKRYLFVNAHLTTGKNEVANKRAGETSRLLARTKKVAEGRPRVFAGDFNSSIQRGKDTVGQRMKAKGFADAYTKTKSRKNAKYNTATGYGSKPAQGGSHIDRVFVPRGASAKSWAMDVRTRKGKAVRPIPTNHSAVRVSIVLP